MSTIIIQTQIPLIGTLQSANVPLYHLPAFSSLDQFFHSLAWINFSIQFQQGHSVGQTQNYTLDSL